MNGIWDQTIQFFRMNSPSLPALALWGPISLAWSLGCLWLAGVMKRKGVRTGYTRKTFHFLVFGTASALHWGWGTSAVCLFGGMCSLAIFYAVWRGKGDILYEAMAREKDEPHRTFFILVPYFTTLVGGLAGNILFGPFAVAGYLVTGLGDAIGEPAGTMFGKHKYRVRSLSSVPATRSLEGSAAVFVMSILALAMAAAFTPQISLASGGALKIVVIAAICTLAEAISPHGWDNATMQIAPSALVWAWMGGY